MLVRPATRDDAMAIAALHAESWRRTYRGILTDDYLDHRAVSDRQAVWTDRLAQARSNQHVLLAEHAGEPRGFACVVLDADPHWGALLDNLHVAAASQGQGLGRRLMADVARWVVGERPTSRLHLWVFKENLAAQQVYDHVGGIRAGEETDVAVDGLAHVSVRYAWEDPRRLMRPIPTLETSRLLLKPIELSDAEAIQPLFAQWDIVRYLNNQVPWPFPTDGALKHFRDVTLAAMERGEQWSWSLRLKEIPDQLIGRIDLFKEEGNNRGFWMGMPWQGRGLMAEAADVVTDYWFNTLNYPVMRVPKAAVNPASRRISERQGMRVVAVDEREYVGGRFLTKVWEITRDEWNARQHVERAGE